MENMNTNIIGKNLFENLEIYNYYLRLYGNLRCASLALRSN